MNEYMIYCSGSKFVHMLISMFIIIYYRIPVTATGKERASELKRDNLAEDSLKFIVYEQYPFRRSLPVCYNQPERICYAEEKTYISK